jgi:AAA+ ATPase superfamily predicted ATPase
MEAPLNPFPLYGYFGPEYICDRETEKDAIVSALRNGRNITLYAPRRIGKTALIHHVFHHLPKWNCVYLDLQESFSFNEFTNSLLAAILNAVSGNKSLLKKMQDWLLTLRPIMSANPHSGAIELEVDFKSEQQQRTSVREALKLLDQYGPGVIALDEFQEIHSWDIEPASIEGWLRSEIQSLKNLRFLFAGSQLHLMSEIFTSAKRPFYASTQSVAIGKIDPAEYSAFIHQKFKSYGFKIGPGEITSIIEWADGNTYNIQLLCNRVFSTARKVVTTSLIDQAIMEVYEGNKLSFIALSNSMTKHQWKLLTAIAIEGKVYQPTGKDFIAKYELGTSASVLRALNYLTERELVYQYSDLNNKNYYEIYDIVLMRWLQKK